MESIQIAEIFAGLIGKVIFAVTVVVCVLYIFRPGVFNKDDE